MRELFSKILTTFSQRSVEQPYSQKDKDTLLEDLRKVGPTKPLGYLPIDSLVKLCKVDLKEFKAEFETRGLKTLLLKPGECSVWSGALYVYDEGALTKLLNENSQTLRQAGWPIEPEAFIRYLKYAAPSYTDLFDLIADAFGDKENPGRKNR